MIVQYSHSNAWTLVRHSSNWQARYFTTISSDCRCKKKNVEASSFPLWTLLAMFTVQADMCAGFYYCMMGGSNADGPVSTVSVMNIGTYAGRRRPPPFWTYCHIWFGNLCDILLESPYLAVSPHSPPPTTWKLLGTSIGRHCNFLIREKFIVNHKFTRLEALIV
jgi:hypothetical protein